MGYEQLMKVMMPLVTSAEAAAALAAVVKLESMGEGGDPAVRAQLDRVVSALVEPGALADLDESQQRGMVGFVTSFLKQALDLVEDPARPPGWVYSDPAVLQSQGQASTVVAQFLAQFAPTLDGLEEALSRNGARILDVGSGVAALSMAYCRHFPAVSVVGLDPWEVVQKLARANVTAAGLDDRITLRTERIEELNETDSFDLVWLPTLFLAPAVLDQAVAAGMRSLRDGGWIMLGMYAPPNEPLPQAITDLRIVRAGGTPLSDDEAIALLERAGLSSVHSVPKTWSAPIRFVVGRRKADQEADA